VKQWLKGKPITKIAEFFQVKRQRRWLIALIDEASRLITCFGVFDKTTTDNTIKVLREGFAEYGTLMDHGNSICGCKEQR